MTDRQTHGLCHGLEWVPHYVISSGLFCAAESHHDLSCHHKTREGKGRRGQQLWSGKRQMESCWHWYKPLPPHSLMAHLLVVGNGCHGPDLLRWYQSRPTGLLCLIAGSLVFQLWRLLVLCVSVPRKGG